MFLRLVGLSYLIAFVSLGSQILGLIGSRGILPAQQLLDAARDGRGRLMRDIKHATVEMKQAVAGMQARFRSAHDDMARSQQRMLRGFVSGLRATVAGVRKEFAAELAGARARVQQS